MTISHPIDTSQQGTDETASPLRHLHAARGSFTCHTKALAAKRTHTLFALARAVQLHAGANRTANLWDPPPAPGVGASMHT
eukprot:1599161-Prymnesium_polylepis.3